MNERYSRGVSALNALAPASSQAVQEALSDIAPDMGRFILEFAYGDIFTRPGLDPNLRQTATIAALTALGNAAPQLRFHVEAGMSVGLSPQAIVEIIYVTTVFSGFPAGINAINAAREVFTSKGVEMPFPALVHHKEERRERGLAALGMTSKTSGRQVLDSLADIAPDFAAFILDFAYGDVISRDLLTAIQKETAMIAAAAARGTMAPQLAVHIKAALIVGMSREAIVEVLIQMAVYAGFPAAINGLLVAREVFREIPVS